MAIDVLKSLGYRVKEGKHLYQRTQYLAGSDEERAADVNRMFADPEVDGIFTLTGGYGTMRALPYLDYETIANNPKILIGYSDITGLLLGIYAKTGLVGFHGPVASSMFSEYTLAEYKKVVVNPQNRSRSALRRKKSTRKDRPNAPTG
jgi:muramoyltetrapeptide carboxypeptidase